MKDPESLVGVFATVVPLRIVHMHSHPPALTVSGEGWSLLLAGQWAWRRDSRTIAEGGKSGTDELWALCGLSVLTIRLLNASCLGDCASICLTADRLKRGPTGLVATRGSSGTRTWIRCSSAAEDQDRSGRPTGGERTHSPDDASQRPGMAAYWLGSNLDPLGQRAMRQPAHAREMGSHPQCQPNWSPRQGTSTVLCRPWTSVKSP